MTSKEKLKKGQKVAETAVWLEGSLVVAKVAIGLFSGSLVLVSDAIHSWREDSKESDQSIS